MFYHNPCLTGSGDGDVTDGLAVDSASGFMSRTLMVLKGKTSPETRLSNEELQVCHKDQRLNAAFGYTGSY